MPPTCFLHVPDPDDQPFDDDEPNKPIAPGDRWCSLWAPREPGGPRLPCHPSIEGTADEWLLIAGAIEAGAARAFGRVAFAPAAGGGELWSPHNSTGDRDHVRLTTSELVELAADVRAKLAPPDRDLKPNNAAPAHPLAEDGSGPTTGAATGYRCLTCGDNGYVLGGVGGMFDEQAEDPCPDCGPASPPAPGPSPTAAPPAAPARVDFTAVDPGLAAQPPGNADFYRARSLFMADRGYPYMTPAEQVVAEQEWEATMIDGPSATAAQAVRLLEAMAAAKPGDSRPPGVPTSAPTYDHNGDQNGPACLCEPGKLDPECGHQADQDRRDADAIVRVLHSGFLPALRAALDRAAPSPDPASHPSDITREAIIARAKALTAGPFLNYEIDDAPRPDGYGNLLIGPGGFRCDLGRYEGAPTWHKGGDDAVSRLGQLNVIVIELMNVIDGKV